MEELDKLGLSENTINAMLELNPNIKDLSNEEINSKIAFLESINCNDNEIRNIISSNSRFLDRTNEELDKLIEVLNKYGFNNLNSLLDSNPFILNLEPFEIDNYINKLKESNNLEEIINDLEENPELFNEM